MRSHHHFNDSADGRPYRPEWSGPEDPSSFPGRRGPGGRRHGRGGRRGGGPGRPSSDPTDFDPVDFRSGSFGPGFGPGGFGPGFGPGARRGRGRGGRARGDVRSAILLLLDEEPRHGYELIQEIAERSAGAWRPSPGSIYPTLQALEDEGLVEIELVDGRKTASLTAQGRAHVDEHRERMGTPWSAPSGHDHGPALAMRQEAVALRGAVGQVARVGSVAQLTAAATILATARKELYRLLAEDTPDLSAPGADDAGSAPDDAGAQG